MSWSLSELSDVAEFFNGKTPSKAEQRDSGAPVLKIKDVTEDGLFKGAFESFVDQDMADKFTQKAIEKDDTLILNAAHNSDYVGNKQYRAENEVVGSLPTGEWLVARAKGEVLDPRFLNYWLGSGEARFKIKQLVKGIHLYPKDVARLEIPLPYPEDPEKSLKEQKRIAAILDKADAIRRKRQQAIQLADEFLRAVFLDMFGKYVTTDGYAKADKAKIRDLVDYIDYRGKTPTKSESGIPLITAKNVKKGFVDVEPREYIPEENYEAWMTRGLPHENDVLFTTEAPLGNVALLGKYEKVVVGQRLIALRSKGRVTHEFLMHLLLDPFVQGLIINRSSGSTVKGIRTKELYEIELPIPDIDRQVEFSNIYWKIKSLTRKVFISSRWNGDIFNSLSQQVFAGKL